MSVPERLLRRREVERIVGLTKPTIYRMMAEGKFPRSLAMGGGAVRWKQTEIMDWIETRPRSKPLVGDDRSKEKPGAALRSP